MEYIWKEISKKSNIASEDTVVTLLHDDKGVIKRKYNWANLYGKLESGEYKFILPTSNFSITIEFTIDKNGYILYNEAEIK